MNTYQSQTMDEFYKDYDYCASEFEQARQMWENKEKFTNDVAEGIEKALAFMYLYCPIELKCIVWSHLNETIMRRRYIQ